MKSLFCLWALLCALISRAQQQPLQIGDRFPGVNLPNLINHSATSLQLAQFKDSSLLINFMSVGCISCLHALPKIDSLSRQYGFSVILVTPDKPEKIKAYKKNKFGKSIRFPILAQDSILKSFFPHQFISHIVWVYKNRVAAITRTDYITANNIETLLAGRPLSLPVKKDNIEYDYSSSLLPPVAAAEPPRSVLLPYKENIPHRFRQGVDTATGRHWFRIINYSLTQIYCKTVGLPIALPKEQLSLMVTDSTRFIFNKQKDFHQQWNATNTFVTKLLFLPHTRSNNAYNISATILIPVSACKQSLSKTQNQFSVLNNYNHQPTSHSLLTTNHSS
ncbi:MAG: redoxin domain-containing protein [Chitinophagaceae bacterium]|nr:redoxin domain-containing protein [Chitinophagaceae bacterium]